MRIRVANRADLPLPDLLLLLDDPAPEVRRQALMNPATDCTAVLNAAATLNRRFVRRRLRALTRDPVQARSMARSSDVRLVEVVARYSDDAEALLQVLDSGFPVVTWRIALRLGLPVPVQRRLLRHDDVHVAGVMAMNPSLDGALQRRLVHRCSAAILLRSKVEKRQRAATLLRASARNPGATQKHLARLARSRCWDVRVLVAAHPSLPSGCAERVANDNRWAVRAAAAANVSVPAHLLARLARDWHYGVRMAVAANASTPRAVVYDLLAGLDVFSWSQVPLVSGRAQWVVGLAVGNPNIPPELLSGLTADMSAPAWVLANVARNPATPPDLAVQIQTWLALGGAGNASIDFDPRTCTGTPIAGTVNWHAYYKSEAGVATEAETHPLWPCRIASTKEGGQVPFHRLRLLAHDPDARVRTRVLDFSPLPMKLIDEMCLDSAEPIARRAVVARTKRLQAPRPRGLKNRLPKTRGARLALAFVFLAIGSLVINDIRISSPPSSDPKPPPRNLTIANLPGYSSGKVVSGDLIPATNAEFDPNGRQEMLDGALVELGTVGSMPAWRITTVTEPLQLASVVVGVNGTEYFDFGSYVSANSSQIQALKNATVTTGETFQFGALAVTGHALVLP